MRREKKQVMRSLCNPSNIFAISLWLIFYSFHIVYCVDSWSDDVNIVCSPSALEVNGTKACEEQCQLRACCFVDGTFNCRKDMESWCFEFSACDNLVKASNSQEQQVEDQAAAEEGHTPVQEACEPSKLQDPDLLSRCEDICSTRRCCWGKGRDNCYDYDPHWCNEYKVCLNLPDYGGGFMHFAGEVDEEELHEQPATTEPPQQQMPSNYIVGYLGKFGILAHDSSTNKAAISISPVEDNCSHENVQKDGGVACRTACSTRSCCFSKGSDNCAKEMPVECNSFRACWILYDRLH